ncbi:type VII secretion target [Mycobacterium sp. GA-2829]|uniref:type VII secretion target n=1 Tax=Mycobacterium sp. GA-2829 TaxID=1772283 RepID=UPI00073FD1D1|nr:type VII secretion target [Mycobacterium sp. GA-2829]KUI36233.1 hypothetical protein AU194_16080 [Mycobacterium sp. GA-2829]
MTDPIHVNPQAMRVVANHHDDVADRIAQARSANDDIHAAVATYGPIMHQVKSAVSDVLAQREAALLEHDQIHRSAADALRREATNYEDQDAINAERLQL